MTRCPRRGWAGPEWAGQERALQVRGLRIPLRWRRNSASSLFSTSEWLQIGHWVVQYAERSANRGPEGGAGWKARGRSLGGPLSPPPGSGGQVVVFLKGQYALKSASPSFQMPETLLTCALEGAVEHVALLPELPRYIRMHRPIRRR